MHIARPQHRPPQDMMCPMLQVSDGCTHGKCRFCDIYTGIPFRPSPMEEIVEDVQEIAQKATLLTKRIYLTGGNPFAFELAYEYGKLTPAMKRNSGKIVS